MNLIVKFFNLVMKFSIVYLRHVHNDRIFTFV